MIIHQVQPIAKVDLTEHIILNKVDGDFVINWCADFDEVNDNAANRCTLCGH